MVKPKASNNTDPLVSHKYVRKIKLDIICNVRSLSRQFVVWYWLIIFCLVCLEQLCKVIVLFDNLRFVFRNSQYFVTLHCGTSNYVPCVKLSVLLHVCKVISLEGSYFVCVNLLHSLKLFPFSRVPSLE